VHLDRAVLRSCGSNRIDLCRRFPEKWTLTQPRNLLPLRQFGASFILERTVTFFRGAIRRGRRLASLSIAALTGTISGTIRTESGFP
jgi:hypothetical protein